MKHTKGSFLAKPEWLYQGVRRVSPLGPEVVDESGRVVAFLAHRDTGDGRDDEAEANAVLFAAAPDLLEAAEAMVESLNDEETPCWCGQAFRADGQPFVCSGCLLRAAIAKARGQSA